MPDGAESALAYTWSVVSGPGGATFSANGSNAAKNTTVTFAAAGTYTLQATMQNGPLNATSSVTVTVSQTPTVITVTPAAPAPISPGATVQFSAAVSDQFGAVMNTVPTLVWSVVNGAGSVDQTGLFTASQQPGQCTVQASASGASAQAQVMVNSGFYKVALGSSRAIDDAVSGGLTVANSNWVAAASPEDAIRQAVTGTVTITDKEFAGETGTATFPNDLGGSFQIAGLTWDPAKGQYTGEIELTFPFEGYEEYFTDVTVTPKPTLDLGIDADNNNGLDLPDRSAAEEAIEEDPSQWGKDVPVDDGTFSPANYTPLTLDLAGVDPSSGTITFSYGPAFQLFAPDGTTLLNPGQAYGPAALGFTGLGAQEVVLKLDAIDVTMAPQEGTITAAVNAPLADGSAVALTDAVQANGQQFKIEQVGFGSSDNNASFHPVRLDPTPTDFSPHVLDTVQWEDLDHSGKGGDAAGERNGPICYTRSGLNGDIKMTMHVNVYVGGGSATGTYQIKAEITAKDEGTFHFDPVAATVGTLNNGLTGKQDTVLTADLTASDFIIPSVIAKEDYNFSYLVSSDGGKTWASAGQSETITYVINGGLPTAWTYNSQKDSQTKQIDTNTDPLWTVLDISCRASGGLAADPDDPWTNYNEIIEAIWAQFVDNVKTGVTDAHGNHMTYWATMATGSKRNADITTGLIANQDGSCGGWAGLLVDCLRAQGVASYVYAIDPIPTFYPAPNPGDTFDGFVASNKHGQGYSTANSSFLNHAVVELTNDGTTAIYDPSYGQWFSSAQAWRDGSEASFQWDTPTGGFDETDHQSGAADSTITVEPI